MEQFNFETALLVSDALFVDDVRTQSDHDPASALLVDPPLARLGMNAVAALPAGEMSSTGEGAVRAGRDYTFLDGI